MRLEKAEIETHGVRTGDVEPDAVKLYPMSTKRPVIKINRDQDAIRLVIHDPGVTRVYEHRIRY